VGPERRRKGYTPGGDVAGLGARKAALSLLDAVLRRGEPMDQAAHGACQRLASDDRALAIAICGDALRWLGALDALIDGATSEQLPDDSKARMVLRIALVQLIRLSIAPHAVVATSLALLAGGPRRLVHALLSRAQREGWALPAVPALPPGAAERWEAAWGAATVAAAAAGWATPPPLDLRFKEAADADAFLGGLSLFPAHRRLPRSGRVEALPGYADGGWWVQDLAASLPAALLGTGQGRSALDLCAAPGGKTMQLAAAGWNVTALDISAKRLERLRANLGRTGLAATLVAADLAAFAPDASFDAVLLDAPCSATGTWRRHPDVLHRVGADAIAQLARLQQAMLARAAGWVAPGGRLIYATCSLEPDEGEAVVADFLADQGVWRVDGIAASELPEGVMPTADGFVRTLPGMLAEQGGLDGFFVARLRRD
jgi:16S rRNA (cytosine967-C5)-methyltransferase